MLHLILKLWENSISLFQYILSENPPSHKPNTPAFVAHSFTDYIFGPFRQFPIIQEPLCGALILTCQGPFQSEMSKLSAVLWMWPRPCGVLCDLSPLLHETSPIFFSFDKSTTTQEAHIKTIRGYQQTPTEATSSKEVLNLMLSQVKRHPSKMRSESSLGPKTGQDHKELGSLPQSLAPGPLVSASFCWSALLSLFSWQHGLYMSL